MENASECFFTKFFFAFQICNFSWGFVEKFQQFSLISESKSGATISQQPQHRNEKKQHQSQP
jgi:hypothetical protein